MDGPMLKYSMLKNAMVKNTIKKMVVLAGLMLLIPWMAAVCFAQGAPPAQANDGVWRFAVSGDSRNCGDVVMPAIAAGVRRERRHFTGTSVISAPSTPWMRTSFTSPNISPNR